MSTDPGNSTGGRRNRKMRVLRHYFKRQAYNAQN